MFSSVYKGFFFVFCFYGRMLCFSCIGSYYMNIVKCICQVTKFFVLILNFIMIPADMS